jgi:hypothetical protein
VTRGPFVEMGSLDEDVLAALEHVLDGRRLGARPAPRSLLAPLALLLVVVLRRVLVEVEVGGVQERGLVRADVDEGRLDAGKDRLDLAQVDVADHAASLRAIDQQLNELVVLQDRDARLALGRVDQDVPFHGLAPRGHRAATRRPMHSVAVGADARTPRRGRSRPGAVSQRSRCPSPRG